MSFTRSRPLAVREEQLRSLRLAVNTPELSADGLPAGPARAAIVVAEEADGSASLSVLVRSLGDGSLACWSWDASVEPGTMESAIDAALGFGEAMGFLFDDDALSEASPEIRRRALDHWWELSCWSAPDAGPGSIVPAGQGAHGSEPDAAAPPAPAGRQERLPLTKFRRRLGSPPAEPLAPRSEGSALGRLRLVKRVRRGEVGDRPPLWLRLLGSF